MIKSSKSKSSDGTRKSMPGENNFNGVVAIQLFKTQKEHDERINLHRGSFIFSFITGSRRNIFWIR